MSLFLSVSLAVLYSNSCHQQGNRVAKVTPPARTRIAVMVWDLIMVCLMICLIFMAVYSSAMATGKRLKINVRISFPSQICKMSLISRLASLSFTPMTHRDYMYSMLITRNVRAVEQVSIWLYNHMCGFNLVTSAKIFIWCHFRFWNK